MKNTRDVVKNISDIVKNMKGTVKYIRDIFKLRSTTFRPSTYSTGEWLNNPPTQMVKGLKSFTFSILKVSGTKKTKFFSPPHSTHIPEGRVLVTLQTLWVCFSPPVVHTLATQSGPAIGSSDHTLVNVSSRTSSSSSLNVNIGTLIASTELTCEYSSFFFLTFLWSW